MTLELLCVLFCGLVFGSFITCASYRLPLEQDIIKKPSYCPSCNAKLGFKDLWPLFSWLISCGICRYCKARIPARYPIIEIVTALVFWLIYARYGITLQALFIMLLAVALLILIVADLEHFIIPDQIHIFLLPLGLAYHFVIGTDPLMVLYGFLAGASIGLALHHGYRILRKKEGLGYGDVKFFAVVGVWLSVFPLVPFLFFSGLFGVVFGLIWRLLGNGEYFPFGPALAVSLFMGVIYPEWFAAFWNVGTYISQMIM
jgi:leader peptidase (prepilin peptidase)/N-methyltransferase